MVTSVAAGVPDTPLPLPIAPIAPEPLVPDVLMPLKLITVIEDDTLCESEAVTVTLFNAEGANARQISAVPGRPFVLTTNTQVNPAPVTLVTTVLLPET